MLNQCELQTQTQTVTHSTQVKFSHYRTTVQPQRISPYPHQASWISPVPSSSHSWNNKPSNSNLRWLDWIIIHHVKVRSRCHCTIPRHRIIFVACAQDSIFQNRMFFKVSWSRKSTSWPIWNPDSQTSCRLSQQHQQALLLLACTARRHWRISFHRRTSSDRWATVLRIRRRSPASTWSTTTRAWPSSRRSVGRAAPSVEMLA